MSPQAQPIRSHPRRRPVVDTALGLDDLSPSMMQLQKGETFHSPTTPPNDCDPVLSIRSLPRRSPTSLESIAINEDDMASILDRLTLGSADEESDASTSSLDDLPAPRGILKTKMRDGSSRSRNKSPFSLDRNRRLSKSYKTQDDDGFESDSGLGTSISSCEAMSSDDKRIRVGVNTSPIGINGSDTLFDSSLARRRQLGLHACKQIERYVLIPLLKETSIRPFHPLIQTVPSRIVKKQIVCLRDLEKTLIWLAPTIAPSPSSYLRFCEFTVQCLHTSVSHLNDRDQRLPSDRPYNNGYFLDLISQVQRYAAMVRAVRDQDQAHPDADSANKPTILAPTLEGGLSKNGQPVELVVTQDGQPISMRTGQPYNAPDNPAAETTFKRAVSFDENLDEGVQRSMARRKKNAPPMDINQQCAHCEKVFKRPCDLTKHEKTHLRPWKCTDPGCKYFEIGWPTEKERDRHLNDKHSKDPRLFTCKFQPCTYASKRESNCKQHMEKAHGWVYVRSKNNSRGAGKGGSSLQTSPSTPSVLTPASKPTDLSTPVSGTSLSSREQSMIPENEGFNFAEPPMPPPIPYSMPAFGGAIPSDDFSTFFEMSRQSSGGVIGDLDSLTTSSVNLNAFHDQLMAGDPSDLVPALEMHPQSTTSLSIPSAGSVPDLMNPSLSFDGSPLASTDNTTPNFDLEWSRLDATPQDEYTIFNMQLGTPGYTESNALNGHFHDMGPPRFPYGMAGQLSSFSPGGQGHLTLYSPDSTAADEGLPEPKEYGVRPVAGNDFTLYDASSGLSAANLAPPMNRYDAVSQYAQAQAQTMFPPLNDRDMSDVQSWPGQQRQASDWFDYMTSGNPEMDLKFMK